MQYNDYGYPGNSLGNFASYRPSPHLKGRYVSSLDEVRAAQIDFDGSVSIFPDITNNAIYTKQINLDGTLSIKKYELTTTPSDTPVYITKEEFENELQSIKASLEERKENNNDKPKKSSTTTIPAF